LEQIEFEREDLVFVAAAVVKFMPQNWHDRRNEKKSSASVSETEPRGTELKKKERKVQRKEIESNHEQNFGPLTTFPPRGGGRQKRLQSVTRIFRLPDTRRTRKILLHIASFPQRD